MKLSFSLQVSIFSALLLMSYSTLAQSVYTPREVLKAYQKETRSVSGAPGAKYWQNKSEYNLAVKVDPFEKTLEGSGTLKYHNNSPDSLKNFILRLYPDLYKKGAKHNVEIDPADITDGVKLSKVIYKNKVLNLEEVTVSREKCLLTIKLPENIAPHDTASFYFEWSFKLPYKTFIRWGLYSENAGFIGFWYPQAAVYDDVDGWDKVGYDGEHEFYNDFNDYSIEITVPLNYIVWATGEPQNLEDMLIPEIYRKYKEALKSESVVHIIDKEDLKRFLITKKTTLRNGWNTWVYKAKSVTDFSFAFSKSYLWDGVKATTDSKNGKSALLSAVYDTASADFYKVADLGKKSIEMMSSIFPAVPYPYPYMTVFNGSDGMEFPMMVNDGSFDTNTEVVYVTSHEIAHTYFPFMVGTNEKKYSWMDEAMAVFLPLKHQTILEPKLNYNITTSKVMSRSGGMQDEYPMMIPSYLLTGAPHMSMAYGRAALALEFLKDVLTPAKFDSTLRIFIYSWEGKHPNAYDFFKTFEYVNKTDLSWFFNPWYYNFGYADLGIKNVSIEDNICKVEIENLGQLPVPVLLTFDYGNGKKLTVKRSPSIWKSGTKSIVLFAPEEGKPIEVRLDSPEIPDVNKENNTYKLK